MVRVSPSFMTAAAAAASVCSATISLSDESRPQFLMTDQICDLMNSKQAAHNHTRSTWQAFLQKKAFYSWPDKLHLQHCSANATAIGM